MVSRPLRLAIVVAWVLHATGAIDGARADDGSVVKLAIHPARIDDSLPTARLLPAEADLKPGNAAVVLLRMPWEQTLFMRDWLPKLPDFATLAPDDPALAELPFDRFASEMRRAAHLRDADWEYPIDDQPLDSILLPDVQGLRVLVGHGMAAWVNQRIARGDFDSAREGILVQMACARHIARTPFMVNQLVAAAIADHGLDGVERLTGRPGSRNLHDALEILPLSLGGDLEAVQLESVFIERSLETLRAGTPSPGDGPGWADVMEDWIAHFSPGDSEPSAAAVRAEIAATGREYFADRAPEGLDLEAASDDEIAMRFLLDVTHRTYASAEAAWRREPREAIAALAGLGRELEPFREMGGRLGLLPPLGNPVHWYLGTHRFGRRARMLEVVEALHNAAARNGGRFPATLAEVPAHVPPDPLTGEPFRYEPAADGRSARLATPPIPGVDEPRHARAYELTLAGE